MSADRKRLVEATGMVARGAAGPPLWKPLALLAVSLAVMAAIYVSPLRDYISNLKDASEDLRRAGVLAPSTFAAVVALLVAGGFPRLLFCAAGGMAFGFSRGFLWSQIGTVAGSYLTFVFVRWGGREFVLQRFPRVQNLARVIDRQGVPAVILARQLPLPTFACNLLLGLLPVRHVHFLLGTIIGIVPEAVPCTLIGSGAVSGSFAHGAAAISAAVVALALVWLGSAAYVRSLNRPDLAMAHRPRPAVKELEHES